MPTVRQATSIIITRGTKPDLKVFLVQRNSELRFMGGYWAFPGGSLIPEDRLSGRAEPETAYLRCALRELFEETGILIGATGKELSVAARRAIREQLLESASVDGWLRILNAVPPDHQELSLVGNLITPPFAPLIYDTRFYHLALAEDITPEVEPGELVNSGFFNPDEAINLWQRGELALAPPVLYLLRLLAGMDIQGFKSEADRQTAKIRAGSMLPLYFVPGIFMTPLRTPTLPPATTTNTFIVGNEKLYLVEPGTHDLDEQQRLFACMDEMISAGNHFEAILLTHHHADHIGAVTAASRRYQLPVRAHHRTYERIPAGYIRGTPLHDGDRIDLGYSPDGRPDWHLLVIHTPGHADDHLCYLDSRYQAALVGDMLSTVSTIVIDPPEGHMRTYLNSLQRLLEYPIKTVFPAHGPAHLDGRSLIRKLVGHRQEREYKIIRALDTTGQTITELLPRVYHDVAPAVYPVAARSLLAGLLKLEEDNVCRRQQDYWMLNQ